MTRYSEFDAIIFDMDGLLVDTEPVWEEAENEMLGQYNINLDSEVRMGLVGLRNDVFLGRLKERYNIPATLDELQVDVIGRMLKLIPEKAKPMAGAAEIIQFAVDNKIPVAIASSSPGAIIDAVVKSNRWETAIPVLCSAEHLLAGKPEPHVYLEAARVLGVEPTRCLALEDSTNGAKAAIAAGMTCYAVPDLSHTRWEAFTGITDQLFHNLHDVLNHLKQAQ